MSDIEIDGTKYQVMSRETVEQLEARGLPNVAAYMRDAGIAAQLIVRRPKGRTAYHVHLFENGRTTRPMSLGAVLRENAKA